MSSTRLQRAEDDDRSDALRTSGSSIRRRWGVETDGTVVTYSFRTCIEAIM